MGEILAFNELELQRIKRTVKALIDRRRPPMHVRNEVELEFVVQGQSVVIQEDRLLWDGSRSIQPVAKATWVKARQSWKVYWMRADLKWHSYEPLSEVPGVQQFCDEVDADPYGCFWG